jgi:transposase
MDAGAMAMANLAGNKAPGGRKGCRQPSSYQELCSISGTTASRHAAAINMPPDRDQPAEKRTPHPTGPETLGQWLLDWQKEFNSQVNKIRWIVEQAIANFKTWRIMHTDYRRPIETFEETITAVASLEFYRTA